MKMINGGPGLLIPPSTRRPSASDRPPLKVAPAITAPHSPSVCTQSSGGGDAVGADYTPRSQHSASETARPAGQELRVTTSQPIRRNGRGSFPSHTFCCFPHLYSDFPESVNLLSTSSEFDMRLEICSVLQFCVWCMENWFARACRRVCSL